MINIPKDLEVLLYIIAGLFGLLIFLLFIRLLREVNCRYWKINRRVELMEQNNELLNTILFTLSQEKTIPISEEINKDILN